ncbi:MAG TPA: IS66 family transposase [Hanamia sp.]|nr:IS66 family transposase [Hanamia sp.]
MDLHLLVTVLKDTLDAKSRMIVLLQESNTLKDEIIETQNSQRKDFEKIIETQKSQIKDFEKMMAVLKTKKDSNNSHIPPSKDENRPKRNQSLREKTDNKPGGQPGHEGTTLECSTEVDEVVKHSPAFCNCCGNDLSDTTETFISSRQLVDIPPIILKRIEHQIFKKQCGCGHVMESSFPAYVANPVQYGPNVEALVGYLHSRQYIPYARMQEFLGDVMGLPVSTGGIHNILQRLAKKAKPFYDTIKERIEQATCIGTDETGLNVNGKKHWMWTWQNSELTYIVCSDNRGFRTIEEAFENGLPNAALVHDRWACHFKMDAKAHQICIVHLLRDLNYIKEIYNHKCDWSNNLKILLQEAMQLKKEFSPADYYCPNEKRQVLFDKLEQWLHYPIPDDYPQSKSLQKSLLAKQDCILYFLLQPNVPPHNNGSEKAVRNVKVKQKISGQFKSIDNANVFAILRSVIDTTIKSGQNVLNSLFLIATFGTE